MPVVGLCNRTNKSSLIITSVITVILFDWRLKLRREQGASQKIQNTKFEIRRSIELDRWSVIDIFTLLMGDSMYNSSRNH